MTERQRLLWAVLLMFLVFVGVTVSGALYTAGAEARGRTAILRVQQEQQQALCAMVRVFIDPSAPPPDTERGRAVVTAIREFLAERC